MTLFGTMCCKPRICTPCSIMYSKLYFFLTFLSSLSLLQESRKKVKLEKKEPLVESQLFIMELARELNKICQVSSFPPLCSLSVTDKHAFTVHLTCIVYCKSSPQRSNILGHIWTSEDIWPASVCRDFIVEWAAVLEKRVQVRRCAVGAVYVNNLISYMLSGCFTVAVM